ncbi:MAG: glycosyltransferase family 4 protein [Acidobacteriia bacterium]|nr:glycosyltransferase family 4 protein [Terriglobia bacterium]
MRVGVDASVLAGTPTGVARYLSALIEHLPTSLKRKDALELFTDRPLPSGIATTVLRWPLPGGDPAWRQFRLGAHLVRRRVDVLFCPFYTIPLVARVPTVVVIHDVSFAAHPEWFSAKSRVAFALAGPSARKARRVVTVSEFSAGEIARHLGVRRERIDVIPPGLDPSWRRPVEATERRAAREWLGFAGPYALHLGAVTARRNLDLVVRAFSRVTIEARLVVVGPSVPPAPDVDDLAREGGIADRVIRRAWAPEPILRGLLGEAAALVYLSEYEGFGLPVLEALAVGTPVLALRRASLPEVLGDVAAWVETDDPREIGAQLEGLMRGGRIAVRLARDGPGRAARFDPDVAAERTWRVVLDAAH